MYSAIWVTMVNELLVVLISLISILSVTDPEKVAVNVLDLCTSKNVCLTLHEKFFTRAK